MWIKLLLSGAWTVAVKLYTHFRTVYLRYRAEFAEMLAEHRRRRNDAIEASQAEETKIESAAEDYVASVPADDKSRLDAAINHKPDYGDE